MLILFCHGLCQGENEKRLVGQSNYELTPQGIEELTEAGKTLEFADLDRIFVADQQQSWSSLNRLLSQMFRKDSVCQELKILNERSGGLFEGMLLSEIRDAMPPRKYRLWDRDYHEAPPSGESFSDVADRVLPWAKQTLVPLQDKRVMVLAGPIVTAILIGWVQGLDETHVMAFPVEHAIPYYFHGKLPG